MGEKTLQELIRTFIQLPSSPNSRGWYPVLCKVCNDHGRKGPRAAFLLEDDAVGYHCFNCDARASFHPHEHNTISKNFESILLDFSVPEDEINRVRFALLGNKQKADEAQAKVVSREPKQLSLPTHFYRAALLHSSTDGFLTHSQKQWITVATLYLEERGIDIDSYPFMLSTGVPTDLDQHPKDVHKMLLKEAQKWTGRIIMPIYKDGKLIFYTGRDMTDNKVKKYESPSVEKHNVIFGFDKLFEDTTKPLYIVEGIFDAMMIDGTAVLGNKLTDNQIYWFNRSNREKVYIPDRFGKGQLGAEQAIKEGWSVSFPEMGGCKDINEAVLKYGKLYVLSTIGQTTTKGLDAKTRIKFYCNDKK